MTPGYAKTRDELPWLPYERGGKTMIINAHNFGGSFSPAVNGKMPIAAWIPTRTQSAEDVVGSNDGTLTNGASIVADSDAGGSHAFSLDGLDDYVSASQTAFSSASWSMWIKHTGVNNIGDAWSNRTGGAAGAQPGFVIGANGSSSAWFYFVDNGTGSSHFRFTTMRTSIFSNNAWTHHAMTYSAATGALRAYLNGVDITSSLTSGGSAFTGGFSSTQPLLIGARPSLSGRSFSGSGDDYRIWNQVLDAADMSDLYAAQRGGDAS